MAIITRKIVTYLKNIKDLSDTPNKDGMTADDLKAFFDGRGDAEIKDSINGIVDDLTAITDGSSGADQIGITPIKVGGSNKVQTAIEELKTDTAADLKAHTDKTDNPHTVTKTQVGLSNVTNESKVTMFTDPAFTGTVSGVTKAMVGLANADNTTDANKPVSSAGQTALNLKVDKAAGKALSTNDYDNTEKASVASNTSARHSHANKAILDTYAQTETDLSDAVTKKHAHTNKATLDTYSQTEVNIADAVEKKHAHANGTVLDAITAIVKGTYDSLVTIFTGITGIQTTVTNDNTKLPTGGAIVSYVTALGGGDMTKAVYDTTNNGTVDNAELVNSLTVQTAVPVGAVFTDTVPTTANIGTLYNSATAKGTLVDADIIGAADSAASFVIKKWTFANLKTQILSYLTTVTTTWTNKRITKRAGTLATGTLAPLGDTQDIYTVTALAENVTVSAPTGTPTEGQEIIIRIKDNGTARTLTWNAIYRSMGVVLPTTTIVSKSMYCWFIYNSTDVKWDLHQLNIDGVPSGVTTASELPIVDTGNKYTATNAETAFAEIADLVSNKLTKFVGTTAGTATVLTATITNATLADFTNIQIRLHADIGASATLNLNGLGAKPIYTSGNVAVGAGALTGSMLNLMYNSTLARWYLLDILSTPAVPIYEENMIKFFAIPSSTGKIRLKIEKPTDSAGVMLRYKTTAWTSGDTKDTGTLIANITDDSNYKDANEWYEVTGLSDGTAYYIKAFPYKDGGYNENIGINETVCKAGGLWLEYTGDNVAGSTVNDTSGNARNGTIAGTITTQAGLVGNSLRNNIQTARVAIPTEVNLTNFTISCFTKVATFPTDSNGCLLQSKLATNGGLALSIYNEGGTKIDFIQGASHATYSATIPTATNIHVLATASNHALTLYYNNTSVATATGTTNTVPSTAPSVLGWYYNSTGAFTGDVQLDQFRIFDRVLESYERDNLYNGGVGC